MDDVKRPPTSNNSGNNPSISDHNSSRVDAPGGNSTSIPVSFGHKTSDGPVERPHNYYTYSGPNDSSKLHSSGTPHHSESYPSHSSDNQDDSSNSDQSEPAKEPESFQESEIAQEPVSVQVEDKSEPHQQQNEEAPIFDSPDTKLEKPSDDPQSSSQSSSQKGAGLDLSSLSNDDANDLGIQKPAAAEDVQIPRTALAANKPKKSNKGTFIVVAILIALALAAGAGYA